MFKTVPRRRQRNVESGQHQRLCYLRYSTSIYG